MDGLMMDETYRHQHGGIQRQQELGLISFTENGDNRTTSKLSISGDDAVPMLVQAEDKKIISKNFSNSGELPSELISAIVGAIENSDMEEPFLICNVATIVNQYNKWKSLLPRVEPFYAIKCNGDRKIVETLKRLGTSFDCASKAEISTLLDLGVDSSRIIFANPCKSPSYIRFAREKGVKLMTFDNLTELVKIKRDFLDADLVLRIATDDSKSSVPFSAKFGAPLSTVGCLLRTARMMTLNVVGVSFHVGSCCGAADQYRTALEAARFVFNLGIELGFHFTLLDIGGGFPGTDNVDITFEQIAAVVNKSLDTYFQPAEFPNLRIIAEPGRYFATTAFDLVVSVISWRTDVTSKSFIYYINEGLYGTLNIVMYEPANPPRPIVIMQAGRFCRQQKAVPLFPSILWGPTCDSLDCIFRNVDLPKLDVGDRLLFRNMGAYTISAATDFNGFPRTKVFYINEDV